MDSMKSFRADEAEEQAYRRKTRKRVIIIIISTILLVLIIVAAILGVVLPSKTSNISTQSPSSTSSFSSIQSICSITQYPKSCISSLTSRQNPNMASDSDPLQLFKLSLQVSIDELSNISSIPESLSTQTNDIRVKNALNDCNLLFSNAIEQLNDSLSSTKLDDIRTWISAALTNQETCLDNIGSVSVEFRGLMQTAMANSTEYTSNSLSIATKVLKLLQNFNLPIHRKLLGEEFPSWVSAAKGRKLL
ncbi:hypothetical protein AAC387_Pa09g2172 [Persea americana]